ncbi:MAG: hypothetical protein HY905_05255 [Deltaproteobacteria bacterium]|nr:hypothetical protein [Deltaproteobacteria bacterium]
MKAGCGWTAILLALPVVLAGAGCRARKDRCGDPVAVAQSFVEAMNGGDQGSALQFLSRAARADLERRSKQAATALGQKIGAADLLVPERSVLPRPEWLVLRTAVGDEAWVDVRPPADGGAATGGPWSTQRLVHEDGCWKVDLFHPVGPVSGELSAGASDASGEAASGRGDGAAD